MLSNYNIPTGSPCNALVNNYKKAESLSRKLIFFLTYLSFPCFVFLLKHSYPVPEWINSKTEGLRDYCRASCMYQIDI